MPSVRLLALVAACTASTGPTDEGGSTATLSPTLGEPVQLVPGDGLPAEAETQDSNNNLDVIVHEGETYFVFRTAPTHFASSETRLHVVRSTDRETWSHELTLHYETDLREPRFLSWDGELLLYFARLGDNPSAFEPGDTMLTVRDADGAWSEPEIWFEEDFIPWRIKVRDGVAEMTGYYGGGDVYELGELPDIQVVWLQSTDGRTWSGVDGADGEVLRGGSSETDLVVLDDGRVVGVARNEAGDEEGWGSWICVGQADAPSDWSCELDPRKYDSPLLFRQPLPDDPDAVWLIGRRHLSETGNYDLTADGEQMADTHGQQTTNNQVAYWNERKRCALWRVWPDSLSVEHVLDLPSAGDTCFPSILPEGGDSWSVWNYSSPFDEDPSWLEGQLATTQIYTIPLVFE